MTGLGALVKRNCKLFFKDKGMFYTAMVTPLILLFLYVSFLANVYHTTFTSAMPAGFPMDDKLIDATVGGQLVSSLLAVSCVTVAFCSGLLMVQDRSSGVIRDLTVSPVKRETLAISYFISTAASTMIICMIALLAGLVYLMIAGWYLSAGDVCLLIADVALLALFGTALSSVVSFPLKTDGQRSAVGTVISAGYGFVCGAYMPISSFGAGLQKALSFLPGTYGTSLLRNHTLGGVFAEMEGRGLPAAAVEALKDSIDCNLYFFGNRVEIPAMYLILAGAAAALVAAYVLLSVFAGKEK